MQNEMIVFRFAYSFQDGGCKKRKGMSDERNKCKGRVCWLDELPISNYVYRSQSWTFTGENRENPSTCLMVFHSKGNCIERNRGKGSLNFSEVCLSWGTSSFQMRTGKFSLHYHLFALAMFFIRTVVIRNFNLSFAHYKLFRIKDNQSVQAFGSRISLAVKSKSLL